MTEKIDHQNFTVSDVEAIKILFLSKLAGNLIKCLDSSSTIRHVQERCDFFSGTSNCPTAPAQYALSSQCNSNQCFKGDLSEHNSQTICQETLDADETGKSFQKKFCALYIVNVELWQFECLPSIGSNMYFQCTSIWPAEEVR